MHLKGQQADAFCKRPKEGVWAVVAHGDDEGRVADAVRELISSWTPKTDDLEVTSLDDDTIRKDPTAFFDGLEAVSLLGDARCIRVRTSGDKSAKHLVEALKQGESSSGRFAARLIIQAGALQKRSKIRAFAESAKNAASLQFFADSSADILDRVKDRLASEGAAIDDDALALFVGDLPGHRSMANSEIEKLALYALGLGRPISVADISALSATDIDHALAAATQATLSGNVPDAHAALDRLEIAGTSPISILRSLQMEALRMLDAHTKLAAGSDNPGMKLRPPVWRSEWPAFSARLHVWPPARLNRLLERIYDAERQAKLSGPSAGPVVRLLMNDLVKAAALASESS